MRFSRAAAFAIFVTLGALVAFPARSGAVTPPPPRMPAASLERVLFAECFSPIMGHASDAAFIDTDLAYIWNCHNPTGPAGAAFKGFDLNGTNVAGCDYGSFYHGSNCDCEAIRDTDMDVLETTNDVSQIPSSAAVSPYQQNPSWIARDAKGAITWNCDLFIGNVAAPVMPFDFSSCSANPAARAPYAADHIEQQCEQGAQIHNGALTIAWGNVPSYSAVSLDCVTLRDNLHNPYDGNLDFSTTTLHEGPVGPFMEPFGGDPATNTVAETNYAQLKVDFLTWITGQLHQVGLAVTFNLHLAKAVQHPTDPLAKLDKTLIDTCDIWADEGGFNNFRELATLEDWQNKASLIAAKATGLEPNGYVSVNYVLEKDATGAEVLVPFAQASGDAAQMSWLLANFLLVRGSHSYLCIKGKAESTVLDYGNMFSPPVGRPSVRLFSEVAGTHLQTRGYEHGLVVVNPDPTSAWSLTLPAAPAGRQWKQWISASARGTLAAVTSVVTLQPRSGLVLVLE